MRVLVTGGRGFIGSVVCAQLKEAGHRVTVFDRQRYLSDYDVSLGDIRDRDAVADAMSHVDAYVHLAGLLGSAETIMNPMPAVITNIIGGLNVMEAAAQYGVPGVISETGNHSHNNTYAITKSTVARFAHMYRIERHLPVSVIRMMNVYGPGQTVSKPYGPSAVRKVAPSFVCRALAGDVLQVYGDGKQVMDMIYIDDVARVLIEALDYTMNVGALPQTIEAGTGVPTTVLDIAKSVTDVVSGIKIEHLPMRPGEPEHAVVVADTDGMERFDLAVPANFIQLGEGMARTVKWYRENWLPEWRGDDLA